MVSWSGATRSSGCLLHGSYPVLSPEGRVAWWELPEQAGSTTYVVWDTETSTELGSRTVEGPDPTFTCARVLLGIDDDGIGYLLNETDDPPITRWDVRADTIEPTDLTYDRTSASSLSSRLLVVGDSGLVRGLRVT